MFTLTERTPPSMALIIVIMSDITEEKFILKLFIIIETKNTVKIAGKAHKRPTSIPFFINLKPQLKAEIKDVIAS